MTLAAEAAAMATLFRRGRYTGALNRAASALSEKSESAAADEAAADGGTGEGEASTAP